MTAEAWVAMRPVGIRGCTAHDHPVLFLQEADGARRLLVRLDEREAGHLAAVFQGVRSRGSRMYETFEQAIRGLGGTVVAFRLLGNRRQGLRGEIEIAGDYWRQTLVPAHPGDVAALAWLLHAEVQLPSEIASQETGDCRDWWPLTTETESTTPSPLQTVLAEPDPEDFDW
jgi:hypothetical protein